MMRRISLSLLLVVLGCATRSDDFSVSGSSRQRIALAGAQVVILTCHCPALTVERFPDGNEVILQITATHSSVGYHGPQHKPTAVAPDLLRFSETRGGNNDVVTLRSAEYRRMHHSLRIDALRIVVPEHVELRIVPPTL